MRTARALAMLVAWGSVGCEGAAASSADASASVDGARPDAVADTADATAVTDAYDVTATDNVDGATTCVIDGRLEASAAESPYEAGPMLIVEPRNDQVQGGCTDYFGGDDDAVVSFRAPRAGRWAFAAQGGQVWTISVNTGCGAGARELACGQLTGYHTSGFAFPLGVTARLAVGQEVYVVVNGCQGSTRCSWRLTATQEPPRGCLEPDRACASGQRCEVPDSGVEADSVCVADLPPALESVEALVGGGLLRVFATGVDPDEASLSVRVSLLDAAGARVGPASGINLTAWGERGARLSASGYGATGDFPGAASAEFVATDAVGLRSAPLRVPVREAPVTPVGGACARGDLRSLCAEGSACNLAGACAAYAAPTLREARAYRTDDRRRSAITLRWEDPNDDVSSVRYEGYDASGTRITAGFPSGELLFEAAATREITRRWSADYFAGAARLRVKLVDARGLESDWRDVAIEGPAVAAAGDECDSSAVLSACAEPLRCTTFDGAGTSSPPRYLCREVARACPAGFEVPALAPVDGGAVAAASGDTSMAPTLPAGIDGAGRACFVWRFTAPREGAWRIVATTNLPEPGPNLEVRRLCPIVDGGSLVGAAGDYHSARAEVAASLAAGEEVFVFATSYAARRISVSVSPE